MFLLHSSGCSCIAPQLIYQSHNFFKSADYTVRKKALEIGAKVFIEKPFSFKKLKIELL